MLEGFVGVILLCLQEDPDACMVINGPIVGDEVSCQSSLLDEGLPSVEVNFPEAYVAGMACVETYLQGEPV